MNILWMLNLIPYFHHPTQSKEKAKDENEEEDEDDLNTL